MATLGVDTLAVDTFGVDAFSDAYCEDTRFSGKVAMTSSYISSMSRSASMPRSVLSLNGYGDYSSSYYSIDLNDSAFLLLLFLLDMI